MGWGGGAGPGERESESVVQHSLTDISGVGGGMRGGQAALDCFDPGEYTFQPQTTIAGSVRLFIFFFIFFFLNFTTPPPRRILHLPFAFPVLHIIHI